MRTTKTAAAVIAVLMILVLSAGCSMTNGTFLMLNEQKSDTSFGASYKEFNGSMARKLDLKAGDRVTFRYLEDEALKASVQQGKDILFEIGDESEFTVPEDGKYTFKVEGTSADGEFLLSWDVG
jgi:plastocyanin